MPTARSGRQDKDNCRVFRDYAKKKRESVWAPFLNLLNRPDDISVNLTAWVVARLACDGRQLMDDADLQFYFTWLKDQLKRPVSTAELVVCPVVLVGMLCFFCSQLLKVCLSKHHVKMTTI